MKKYYKTGMNSLLTDDLLQRVIKKFHYNEESLPELRKVVFDIRNCIKDQEGMEIDFAQDWADVSMSLGSNLDMLLEKYSRLSDVEHQLMADNIVSEIMLDGYRFAVNLVEEFTEKRVIAMHFWGSEDDYPIEKMEEVVGNLKYIKLKADAKSTLRPSKSAIFQLELKDKRDWLPEDKFVMLPCMYCELGRNGGCDYGKG